MASEFRTEINDIAEVVSTALDEFLEEAEGPLGRVVAAMRHSALAGGKRLRPFLTIAAADIFDCHRDRSIRVGCALEMIHCYSLIHDDLPSMDDADTRRGKPSVHKAYDEATAILAGDALLTQAFEVLADEATHPDPDVRCRLIRDVSIASGKDGMVGGQMIDIYAEQKDFDLEAIEQLQSLKTGALIKASTVCGGIVGGASVDDISALSAYAEDLGLAFQIVDDLLDAFGSAEDLGKPVGQDVDMDKATFVKLMGAEKAKAKAELLVGSAKKHVSVFGPKASALVHAADFVFERKS
ncbi:MAG: polyprenyl synthetase family protein [Pseudomonadota bacterium]